MDTNPPPRQSYPRSLDGVVPSTTLNPHTHTHTHTPLNSLARPLPAEPNRTPPTPKPHRFRWPTRSLLLGLTATIVTILFATGAYALFLGGTSGTNPSTSINLQKGLVGYWQLNGNAKDSTPYSNNGTVNNATPTTGPQGQANGAYSFNGTTADITMAKNVTLGTGTTIGLWVKTTFSSSQAPFVSNRQGSPSGSIYFGISLGHLFLYDNGASPAGYTSTGTIIDDGNWHYVAVTMTGTTTTLYIDGVSTAKSMTTNSTIGALQFGHDASTGNYFPGSIAQVRIYNRALNPNEVTALYHEAGNGLNIDSAEAGLVGEWKLNGNAKDSTPYSNNGTLVNAPTPTTGPNGQNSGAMSFSSSGSGSYINLGTTQNYDYSSFTVSVWAKSTVADPPHVTNIVGKGNWNNTNDWFLGFKNGTDVSFVYGLPNWADGPSYSLSNYDATQWHHYVGVATPTTESLYIDGKLVSSVTLSHSSVTNTYPLQIARASYDANIFNGSIADVRIYNQALTASQIANLYQAGTSQIEIGGSGLAGSISLGKGLVGYWPFHGNAKDQTPYSDNGTIVGGVSPTTNQLGQPNGAYSFDGSSGYIDYGTPSVLQPAQTTWSAWIYPTNVSADQMFMTDQGNSANYFRIVNSSLYVSFYVAGVQKTLTGTTLSNNTWYFVTATYNGSAITLYLNGQQDAQLTGLSGNLTTAAGEFDLGRWTVASPRYFTGSMDNVRIYNRALSAAEVSALYSED